MDTLKLISSNPQDHALKVVFEYYRLKNFEYELSEVENNSIDITFKSKKKVDSSIVISTTDLGLKGYITLYPPVNDGHMLTMSDVIGYIESKGVINFDVSKVQEAFKAFQEYKIIYQLQFAEGIPPKEGRDAELIYHYDIGPQKRVIKNGKIDFKESARQLPLVSKGDKLITKKPPVQGSKGVNIYGEDIQPHTVKDITIILSDGATVNEAGNLYTATTNGYVDFNGVKLGVYPVYVVENVDYSTGNIKFNGSVYVKGDVLAGFKIEALKNVVVDGVCQDCEIIAKGDITLQSGMKCKKNGILKADGNVLLGYAENATIYTKGTVDIRKYLYNCNVYSGLSVIATNAEGIIAGGNINAFQEVSCKQLGTTGNSNFSVSVGSKFYFIIELEKIMKEKARITETLDKIETVLDRINTAGNVFEGSNSNIEKMLELKTSLTELINKLSAKEKTLKEENRAKNPKVKVQNKIFDGVTVRIHEGVDTLKEARQGVVGAYDEKYNAVIWTNYSHTEKSE